MARFPGAVWKPITADKDRQRLTVYNRMNLHVAVSEASSLHGFFNQRGIADSHFYVRRDGTVEQYVDTSMRAYADLEGNDATISVETQGMGPGEWTPQQCASLVDLYVWAVRTHGIARKVASSSKTDTTSHGLSWHRLGCDGNFPSLPSILAGRTQRGGGMHWSKSLGKVCPGDDRIKQIPSIFKRAEMILGGTPQQEASVSDFTASDRTMLGQLHQKLLRDEADGSQPPGDVVELQRRNLIVSRRTEADVNTLVASNAALSRTVAAQAATLTTFAKSAGLDPQAVTTAIDAAVKTSLANIEITLSTEA